MTSSIYINQTEPNTAIMDFSYSPAVLTNKETCYGFAFQKTLEQLGLEYEVNPEITWFGQMIVAGNMETIKSNIPRLQRHIGIIARYGAEKGGLGSSSISQNRRFIGRTLGILTQRILPELSISAPLPQALAEISYPLADNTNNDGVCVYYDGQIAPWRVNDLEKSNVLRLKF